MTIDQYRKIAKIILAIAFVVSMGIALGLGWAGASGAIVALIEALIRRRRPRQPWSPNESGIQHWRKKREQNG